MHWNPSVGYPSVPFDWLWSLAGQFDHFTWTMSMEPQAPGNPTAEYHFDIWVRAVKFCGMQMYSSCISMKMSRKRWKNFSISVAKMWVSGYIEQNPAPVPKIYSADITKSLHLSKYSACLRQERGCGKYPFAMSFFVRFFIWLRDIRNQYWNSPNQSELARSYMSSHVSPGFR